MTLEALLAMALLGLAGGVHCVGMCGGIVAALSASAASRKVVPIADVSGAPLAGPTRTLPLLLAYNAGRIGTYAFAGAVVGALGSTASYAAAVLQTQRVMYVAVSLMLVLTGLYVAGVTRVLGFAERAGGVLWRRVQPLTRSLVPATTPGRALAAGALWGWVPCGLVYSALVPALASGTATGGAAMMAAFGAGTLPWLLASGTLAARIARLRRTPGVRRALGAAVALLGVAGLLQMAHASGLIDQALAVCFGPRHP